jgi:hypothetical protein
MCSVIALDLFWSDGHLETIEFTAQLDLAAQARVGATLCCCTIEHVIFEVTSFANLTGESFVNINVARCTSACATAFSDDALDPVLDCEVHDRVTVATFKGGFGSVW